MEILGKIINRINRIATKPGYKILAGVAAVVYMLGNYYMNNLHTTAHIDSEGYVYAITTGSDYEELPNPIKFNRETIIYFDTWKYDSE
jgi:hypothetical protein